MSTKTYQLYCQHCHYKRITDGSDISDLHEHKTASIPRGQPMLDPEAKKTKTPQLHGPAIESGKFMTPAGLTQPKKFKCPKCGRLITARKINPTEHDSI